MPYSSADPDGVALSVLQWVSSMASFIPHFLIRTWCIAVNFDLTSLPCCPFWQLQSPVWFNAVISHTAALKALKCVWGLFILRCTNMLVIIVTVMGWGIENVMVVTDEMFWCCREARNCSGVQRHNSQSSVNRECYFAFVELEIFTYHAACEHCASFTEGDF